MSDLPTIAMFSSVKKLCYFYLKITPIPVKLYENCDIRSLIIDRSVGTLSLILTR
jgi:hypothetical protein